MCVSHEPAPASEAEHKFIDRASVSLKTFFLTNQKVVSKFPAFLLYFQWRHRTYHPCVSVIIFQRRFLICYAIVIIIHPWGLPYWVFLISIWDVTEITLISNPFLWLANVNLDYSEMWLRLIWDQILSCDWLMWSGIFLRFTERWRSGVLIHASFLWYESEL